MLLGVPGHICGNWLPPIDYAYTVPRRRAVMRRRPTACQARRAALQRPARGSY